MIMNCEQYTGKCVCGREHTLETRKVVVAEKAIEHFEEYMQELGLTGRRTVVYDEITWKLTEGKHVKADQNIVLDPHGLRAEDVLIEKMWLSARAPSWTSAATPPSSWASPLWRSRLSPPLTASRPTSARRS